MRNLELVMIVLVLLDGVEMVILACFQTALGGHVSSFNQNKKYTDHRSTSERL